MIWQHFHKVLHVTLFTVLYFPCDVGRSRNFYGRGTSPTACLQLIFPSFLAVPRYLIVNARPFKGWCTGALNFITVSKPRQFTVPWVFVGSSGSRASTILVSHIPKLFPAPYVDITLTASEVAARNESAGSRRSYGKRGKCGQPALDPPLRGRYLKWGE